MKAVGFFRFQMTALHVLCLLLLSVTATFAQDVNGTIIGVVADPSGAVVPSAKVTALNIGTRAQIEGKVLSDGSYSIALKPGIYEVTVEAPGFKSTKIQGVHVEVNVQSRADATLSVGSSVDFVEVNAINGSVDTTTSTLKETIGEQTIEEMPLNGRNPVQLILLVPGVVRDPKASVTSGATYPGASGISINGNRSNTTNYILDGNNHNDNYTNAPSPLPNPDALQEFSVQTNNFGAEFGRLPGGVVNAVTKSGTNQFHGSAFEYLRNNFFNAANHFAAVTNGVKTDDGLKRHQFGGTVGGPFYLPHLYDGRDKSFFFISVQETLIHQRPNATSAVVPDTRLRNGDFGEIKTPLYIPFDSARRTYANNQITNISPVAQALLKYIPIAPTGTPVNAQGGQTIFFRTTANSNDYQLLTRFDQKLSKNNQLYGTFFNSHQSSPGFLDPNNYLAVHNAGDWISRRYQASDTHIFSATLLNQASFSYSHNRYQNTPVYPAQSPSDIGVNASYPADSPELLFAVTGYFSIGTGDTNSFIRDEYQGIETIRWTRGRHQMSFGGEYYFGTGDNINNFQQNPIFTYTASSYTPNPGTVASSTTNSFADFMAGRFVSFKQGAGEYKNTRFNHWAIFLEDSWKATSKLTLNFGTRYEPFLPYYDLNNKLAVWRPGMESTLYPNAPSGVLFVGDPGIPHGGFHATYTNVAPRVGLAYDVFGDGKTSLRAGYGIFFDQPNTITTNNQTDQAPFAPVITLNGSLLNNSSDPYAGATNPFPYPQPPSSNSTFPQYTSQYLYSSKMRNGYTQSWNLQVQQDLGKGTILSVAYAGSAGTHLPVVRELNAAVYMPGSSTTANTNQRRPLGPALGSTSLLSPSASSSYNSVQWSLKRQYSRGFSVLANYTFSKAMDTSSDTKTLGQTQTNPYNSRFDRGVADFDRRHVINVSTNWHMPIPFSNSGFSRVILGGWEHTTIFNYTGGYPFSILSGVDNALTGTGNQRVDSVPGQRILLGKRSTAETQTMYFNTAAFTANTIGTFGNTGRNIIRGPAYTTLDMGLLKNIPIHEVLKMTFRFEAFNIFNHTNLMNPTNTQNNGNFGRITSAYDPRVLQFALRLTF